MAQKQTKSSAKPKKKNKMDSFSQKFHKHLKTADTDLLEVISEVLTASLELTNEEIANRKSGGEK